MFENVLKFERRGCEFWKDAPERKESDIGNYRITTPGEIIPGKDGRMYCLEFGSYDRRDIRRTNKRNGRPLLHPVSELVMTCATHIDSQFSDDRGSWCNLEMETEFYKTPRKYTEKNILDYVNSISTQKYDKIAYVVCFETIQPVERSYTPASLIYEWAKKNHLETVNTPDGVRVKLHSGEYKYMYWEIKNHANGADESVRVWLERV